MRKLQILIVDDNKMNQVAIRSQVFKSIQIPVDFYFANDGEESVQICNEKAFDLIFMDYNMPKMNGDTATQLIRNRNLNPFDKCTILTCTATTNNEIGYQGVYPGANARLEKPIELDALRSILEKFKCTQETLVSTEDNQNDMVETNLRQRTTKTNSNGLFSYSTQSLDQSKNNNLEEEEEEEEEDSCCRKYCTIL